MRVIEALTEFCSEVSRSHRCEPFKRSISALGAVIPEPEVGIGTLTDEMESLKNETKNRMNKIYNPKLYKAPFRSMSVDAHRMSTNPHANLHEQPKTRVSRRTSCVFEI